MSDRSNGPDSLEIFFADTSSHKLAELSLQPALLDEYIVQNYPATPWGSIAPDTQEAQDAATASEETTTLSENHIYNLLQTNPKAWEAILEAIKRGATPGAADFFKRYHVSDLNDNDPLLIQPTETDE